PRVGGGGPGQDGGLQHRRDRPAAGLLAAHRRTQAGVDPGDLAGGEYVMSDTPPAPRQRPLDSKRRLDEGCDPFAAASTKPSPPHPPRPSCRTPRSPSATPCCVSWSCSTCSTVAAGASPPCPPTTPGASRICPRNGSSGPALPRRRVAMNRRRLTPATRRRP